MLCAGFAAGGDSRDGRLLPMSSFSKREASIMSSPPGLPPFRAMGPDLPPLSDDGGNGNVPGKM